MLKKKVLCNIAPVPFDESILNDDNDGPNNVGRANFVKVYRRKEIPEAGSDYVVLFGGKTCRGKDFRRAAVEVDIYYPPLPELPIYKSQAAQANEGAFIPHIPQKVKKGCKKRKNKSKNKKN